MTVRKLRQPGGRTRPEYLGGTKFRFHWPCGATRNKDYGKGPIPKRMGAGGCAIMARMWSSTGASALCPKCKSVTCGFTSAQLMAMKGGL